MTVGKDRHLGRLTQRASEHRFERGWYREVWVSSTQSSALESEPVRLLAPFGRRLVRQRMGFEYSGLRVKRKTNDNWLEDVFREIDEKKKNSPIIKSDFQVVEVTPSKPYRRGDGHGGSEPAWTQEKRHVVAKGFETEEAAREWMKDYEPDKGNEFKIRQMNLRRFTEDRWVNW